MADTWISNEVIEYNELISILAMEKKVRVRCYVYGIFRAGFIKQYRCRLRTDIQIQDFTDVLFFIH